ncbi:MAG: hypothetical protein DI533_17340 [Cereibacter sphaeroides]|uniref:Uncharacterized protein n=1 Tax=Cereibacter sphaeroides TaxID=1063 RepID=A0A2W5RZU7_CERSP|nr:MAG: hypothetical protein DI533_17340 [Cereibacter sphaeroides]
MDDPNQTGASQGRSKKVRIELEFEDLPDVKTVEVEKADIDAVITVARSVAGFEDAHVFERDSDEVLGGIGDRRAIILLVHRCRHIAVEFHYEHETKKHSFSPAATILRVLQWAVGKHGFKLDDNTAAKANLILHGSEQPLPKDAMLGRYAKHPACAVTLDLTLKDFTNG